MFERVGQKQLKSLTFSKDKVRESKSKDLDENHLPFSLAIEEEARKKKRFEAGKVEEEREKERRDRVKKGNIADKEMRVDVEKECGKAEKGHGKFIDIMV